MTTRVGFIAQYYELSLHVRTREGKWTVVVFGPNGLLLTHDTKYDSDTAALQAAVGVAQTYLHDEKHDERPALEVVDWQPA